MIMPSCKAVFCAVFFKVFSYILFHYCLVLRVQSKASLIRCNIMTQFFKLCTRERIMSVLVLVMEHPKQPILSFSSLHSFEIVDWVKFACISKTHQEVTNAYFGWFSYRVADAAFPQDIECTYTPSGQHIESCTAKYIFGTPQTPGPSTAAPLEARIIAPQGHEVSFVISSESRVYTLFFLQTHSI